MYSGKKRTTIHMIKNKKRGNKMESFEGKHFSITDPKDVNTVIYSINKKENEFLKDSPKLTVE